MRENRPSGSEGGGTTRSPYPYYISRPWRWKAEFDTDSEAPLGYFQTVRDADETASPPLS
jgi:hypothetical protein